MGKSRLAPIIALSLPRLEPNAAIVGVQIAEVIKKDMSLPFNTFKY